MEPFSSLRKTLESHMERAPGWRNVLNPHTTNRKDGFADDCTLATLTVSTKSYMALQMIACLPLTLTVSTKSYRRTITMSSFCERLTRMLLPSFQTRAFNTMRQIPELLGAPTRHRQVPMHGTTKSLLQIEVLCIKLQLPNGLAPKPKYMSVVWGIIRKKQWGAQAQMAACQ